MPNYKDVKITSSLGKIIKNRQELQELLLGERNVSIIVAARDSPLVEDKLSKIETQLEMAVENIQAAISEAKKLIGQAKLASEVDIDAKTLMG